MRRFAIVIALMLPAMLAGRARARPDATAPVIGFTLLSVTQPGAPGAAPLAVGVWYPANGTPVRSALGPMQQDVAPDAPPRPGAHALVLISHGHGGWLGSHLDTALALAAAGVVVAAPTHAGDDYRDQSRAADPAMRVRQMRAVIDAVLHRWPGGGGIDPRRIGVFGFSSGGLTALLLAGARPDLSRVAAFCAVHPADYGCRLRAAHPPGAPIRLDGLAEPRIRAIAVAAPALGESFTPAAFRAVTIPVSLWRAGADSILPRPDGTQPMLQGLRDAGVRVLAHTVEGADHWDFLAPCTEALARLAPAICQERGGFDRAAFHRRLDASLAAFFQGALSRQP